MLQPPYGEYVKEPGQRIFDSPKPETLPQKNPGIFLSHIGSNNIPKIYRTNSILKDYPKITLKTSCPEQYKSFEESQPQHNFMNGSRVMMTKSLFVYIHLFTFITAVQNVICFDHKSPQRKHKCLDVLIINYECKATTKDCGDQSTVRTRRPVPD